MKKQYPNQPRNRTSGILFGTGVCLVLAAPNLVRAQMSPAYTLPFNGTTQYAAVPNNSTLEITTGTVEMWVKPDWVAGSHGGPNPCLIGERTANNQNTRFSLHIRDNLSGLGIWNGSYFLTVNYNFTQGQWYHIAAVMNAGTTDFYVNGSYVASTSNSINSGVANTKLCVGAASPMDVAERFKGEIDEVRVWSTARTAAQISANKSVSVPAGSAGLVAYYPIDQNITDFSNAKTALLKDYAASSLNGQLYNYWVPVITGMTPSSGPVGTQVAVSGTNLAALTSVSFNGTTAPTYSAAATANADLTVTVPAGATSGTIQVSTATSGAATSPQSFTVTPGDLVVSSAQSGSGTYRNVTIQSGGTLTLTGTLTVTGTVTVQAGGTLKLQANTVTGSDFVLAPGGTLSIGSSAGIAATGSTGGIQTTTRAFASDANYIYGVAQTGSETGSGLPAQVRSLSAMDLTGTSPSAYYLKLTNDLAIAQVLRLDYDLNTNGKNLTLLSTPLAGSALVYNNGGAVQGAATVQRAFDPTLNSGLGYRQLSAPVSNTTVADLATPGFAPVVNPNYNTSATPTAETPFPTVYSYEQSRMLTANNLTGFDKGWKSPAALTDALTMGQGYTVNLPASEVVDFVGTLNNNALTVMLGRTSGATAADGGWQLLGNPYPSPLDLSLVAAADRVNLDAAVYVSQSLGQYTGQYRAYVNNLSTSTNNSPILPSSQGFFVRVSAGQTSGSFTFRNSQRVTTFDAGTSVQRTTADTRPQVHLALRGSSSGSDAAIVYFESGATAGYDGQYDAAKLPNTTGLNLSTASAGGPALAIDGRDLPTASLTIPLNVYVPATGTYTLEADKLLNLNGLHPYLRDTQLGTLTDLTQQPSYSFSQNAAFIGARFELVLTPAQPLATAPAATQAQVAVYPNPAQAVAYVELPAALGTQPVAATLLDALGREVRAVALPAQGAQAHQLSLAGLPAGVYALRLRTSAGTVAKRLVIE